jgi:hypothetical protein
MIHQLRVSRNASVLPGFRLGWGGSEPREKGINGGCGRGLEKRWRVAHPANKHARQRRNLFGHAIERVLAQKIGFGIADCQNRRPPQRPEQGPKIDRYTGAGAKRLDERLVSVEH